VSAGGEPLTLVPPTGESGTLLGSRSADNWSPLLGPLLLVVGLTVFVVVGARLRAKGRRPAGPSRAPGESPGSAAGREAVERMLVDLEEVARSISAMLDTRMRALERLICDADDRLERLRAAGLPPPGADQSGGTPAERPGAEAGARGPAGPTAAEATLAHHASIYRLADQGLSIQDISEQTGYQSGEIELVLSLRRVTRPGEGHSGGA
jgi:hypothetical protein